MISLFFSHYKSKHVTLILKIYRSRTQYKITYNPIYLEIYEFWDTVSCSHGFPLILYVGKNFSPL